MPVIAHIADYHILELLSGGPDEMLFAATPPSRLNLAVDLVAVRVVFGLTDEAGIGQATEELRIFAAAGAAGTSGSHYLAQLYDAGQDDDAFFYAVEYPSLGTLGDPALQLSPDQCLGAVSDVARGAHALHELGMAHGSITPSRILVRDHGAKLGDRSMARFISAGLTVSRLDVGDIDYLDPAVIRSGQASRASDIWSLGVVLHWALSEGRSIHPGITGQQPLAAIQQVLNNPPLIASTLPPELMAVIDRALAADPADRPPTAADLADQIDQLRRT